MGFVTKKTCFSLDLEVGSKVSDALRAVVARRTYEIGHISVRSVVRDSGDYSRRIAVHGGVAAMALSVDGFDSRACEMVETMIYD